MPYKNRYKELERYLTPGKLGVEERARNWPMVLSRTHGFSFHKLSKEKIKLT